MNIPGFTAEAALHVAGEHYQMADNYESHEAAEQILPQLPATWCQHDPYNICNFICCTVTIGPFGVPTIRCTRDWICGHKNPGAASS
jgi:hypothetical protein